MFSEQRRYGHDPEVVRRSKTKFADPLKWKEPKLIFTCSWSDWFHKDADPWRDEAWEIIKATPQHTYQILTKRPGRIQRHLPADWGPKGYANVWLGTSVENQDVAFRAWQLVRAVAAPVLFLSCEPLLGPLEGLDLAGIQWLIAGGESGARHRPVHIEWIRDLRERCRTANVPFFFKQWGGRTSKVGGRELDGQEWNGMPIDRAEVVARRVS